MYVKLAVIRLVSYETTNGKIMSTSLIMSSRLSEVSQSSVKNKALLMVHLKINGDTTRLTPTKGVISLINDKSIGPAL